MVDNNIFIVAHDITYEVNKLGKNAFAYTLQDARFSTTSGTEIELSTVAETISAIMRFLTHIEMDVYPHNLI